MLDLLIITDIIWLLFLTVIQELSSVLYDSHILQEM